MKRPASPPYARCGEPSGVYPRRRFLKLAAAAALPLLGACSRVTPQVPGSAAQPGGTTVTTANPAFESSVYRDLFAERGRSAQEVAAKIDAAWQSLFASTDDNRRVYYPAGGNEHGPVAYVKDIGNGDIRSEGMSYGMMIAVQLDKRAEFDAIWNWAKTHMQHQEGMWQGYFSWHNREDGTKIDNNPASDGEEWLATALFFAAGRWGGSEGIYNYRAEADAILNTMLHKTDMLRGSSRVTNMFDR